VEIGAIVMGRSELSRLDLKLICMPCSHHAVAIAAQWCQCYESAELSTSFHLSTACINQRTRYQSSCGSFVMLEQKSMPWISRFAEVGVVVLRVMFRLWIPVSYMVLGFVALPYGAAYLAAEP